jgi:GNAT superfamily N-acetyltransferase
MSDVAIREAIDTDAESVAELSGQLGYPTTADTIRQRLDFARRLGGHVLYVAEQDGRVVAWMDVSISHHIQSGAYVEIGGLVVASGVRGLGIGARLVRTAEEWARSQGMGTVLVRSQIAREDAHRFYLREGYERTKTSAVFQKRVR